MHDKVNWSEVAQCLDMLYYASDRLSDLFPGRHFTLDGHLVGSIGEVIAGYMFDLDLNPGSTKGHDAVAPDGRRVEIKLTQRKSVAIRHQPDHLIVLHRPKGGPASVVFNGPGHVAWEAAGAKASNGQRPVGLKKLCLLSRNVSVSQRLPEVRAAPI